eukprot:jgi/Hompol1/6484/HPOL_000774-RA
MTVARNNIPDLFDKACGTDLKESKGIESEHVYETMKATYEGRIALISDDLMARIRVLEQEKSQLEKGLLKAETEAKELRFDLNRSETEINEFQLQINYYRKEGKNYLICPVDGLRTIETEIKREVDSFKNRLRVAQAQVKSAEAKADALQHEIDKQKVLNHQLEKQSEESNHKQAEAERQRDVASQELEQSIKTGQYLREQLSEHEHQIEDLCRVNTELSIATKKAIDEQNVTQAKNDDLEKVIGELMKYPETAMGPDFSLKGRND